MLVGLLGGILLLGVSPAFAEGPQLSDQVVLKAWGQTQMAVEPISELLTPERTRGLTPLTDEELDQITGAGFGPVDIGAKQAVFTYDSGNLTVEGQYTMSFRKMKWEKGSEKTGFY